MNAVKAFERMDGLRVNMIVWCVPEEEFVYYSTLDVSVISGNGVVESRQPIPAPCPWPDERVAMLCLAWCGVMCNSSTSRVLVVWDGAGVYLLVQQTNFHVPALSAWQPSAAGCSVLDCPDPDMSHRQHPTGRLHHICLMKPVNCSCF